MGRILLFSPSLSATLSYSLATLGFSFPFLSVGFLYFFSPLLLFPLCLLQVHLPSLFSFLGLSICLHYPPSHPRSFSLHPLLFLCASDSAWGSDWKQALVFVIHLSPSQKHASRKAQFSLSTHRFPIWQHKQHEARESPLETVQQVSECYPALLKLCLKLC